MDVLDHLDAVKRGTLSRRAFQRSLLGFGIGALATPFAAGRGMAQQAQGSIFTWGGYDLPEFYPSYIAANGAPPDFAVFDGTESALTRMRSGFVVDVAHPCSSDVMRWAASGLFQPIDTSRLSNWGDVIPELVNLEGNKADNGMPWLAPFDWGSTSVTYRTDLVELEGEESWDILWDARYGGKIGMFGSGGDAWWSAAIKAGVPFDQIHTDAAFDAIAAVLREQRPLVRVYTDDTATIGQALSSGELVAAMTWNSTAVELQAEDIPVKFAKPKEGALTWVCGLMLHRDAPNPDRAYEIIDAMLSVDAGKFMIGAYGYGHSNSKAFEAFTTEELEATGLSATPSDILGAGHFSTPQNQEWESRMNETYEMIKAGF